MYEIKVFTTIQASDDCLAQVRGLLDQAFEGDFSEHDWNHALGGWHVVAVDGDGPIGHASVVSRAIDVADRRLQSGYVEAVATVPRRQQQGLGSTVMAEVGELVRSHFEMGALSTGAHDFYSRLGWKRWLGPTFVRVGSQLERTENEDDGVMVLLFGTSQELDLTAPISCEARSGDAW